MSDTAADIEPERAPRGEGWLYAWGGANVAIGVASLLVPLYVVQLGGDAVALGVLWFATSMAMAPSSLAVGPLTDRFGHQRTVVLVGFAGIAVAFAALPLLGSVAAVVVADAALWLFVAAVTPVITTLVLADAPQSRWNGRIARLNKYQGYGWTAGLVLGSVWTLVVGSRLPAIDTQRALLWLCAAITVACTAAAARSLPSEPGTRGLRGRLRSRPSRRAVRAVFSPLLPGRVVSLARTTSPRDLLTGLSRPLIVYFAAVSVFFAGFSVFSAPLPDFLTQAGFGDGAVFALYVVSSLASAVFYVGAGELADRYDLRRLQSGALGLRAVVFPVVAAVGYAVQASTLTGLAAVACLFALTGLSWAVIAVTANSLVARYASPGNRGAALGLYTALSSAAGGVGGLLGGWLAAAYDYVPTFTVAAVLVVAGAAVVLALDAIDANPTN
ncbi:MFS transporter [Salarchaeum japonicum]|uniref:Major facilitator superfamily (MFS) profile domain-containing protein n=1 Tax=Salarchaeum japonicum TaxID=555573 RepID=A0AAV3T455_9EURY|nr:MFS transporter [Salarchaeum japonicum]